MDRSTAAGGFLLDFLPLLEDVAAPRLRLELRGPRRPRRGDADSMTVPRADLIDPKGILPLLRPFGVGNVERLGTRPLFETKCAGDCVLSALRHRKMIAFDHELGFERGARQRLAVD